jgi:hypothetical protein
MFLLAEERQALKKRRVVRRTVSCFKCGQSEFQEGREATVGVAVTSLDGVLGPDFFDQLAAERSESIVFTNALMS